MGLSDFQSPRKGETPMLVASGFRIFQEFLVGKAENLFYAKGLDLIRIIPW